MVIFNEEGTFEHNIAMRSTGILVVVDIPYNPWSKICFGFHPPEHSSPTIGQIVLDRFRSYLRKDAGMDSSKNSKRLY